MSIEKPPENFFTEELQSFINDQSLDLPTLRRDISKKENVRWLLRNILIKNQNKIPPEYYQALVKLLKK